MTTQTYFEGELKDISGDGADVVAVAIGTTGLAGEGPQLYLQVGTGSLVMSHEDAQQFCSAAARVAQYLGYSAGSAA